MSRATDLIALAAASMERGEDPFHISFLSVNDVTLDEVYEMSDALALAARILLSLKANHPDTLTVLMVEVATGDAKVASIFGDSVGMSRVTQQLRYLGAGR